MTTATYWIGLVFGLVLVSFLLTSLVGSLLKRRREQLEEFEALRKNTLAFCCLSCRLVVRVPKSEASLGMVPDCPNCGLPLKL